MTEHIPPTVIATIQAYEAAIVRIRTAIRQGTQGSEEVGEDLLFLLHGIEGRLIQYAKRVASLGPGAFEEALDALRDCVFDDIWNLEYQSLETQFGAYLNTRLLRVLQQIRRKYQSPTVSFPVERLDHTLHADGQLLIDTISDPQAEAMMYNMIDAEAAETLHQQIETALQRLPAEERWVIQQRAAGVSNNAIAEQLGVSIATASRIAARARTRLKSLLALDGGTS